MRGYINKKVQINTLSIIATILLLTVFQPACAPISNQETKVFAPESGKCVTYQGKKWSFQNPVGKGAMGSVYRLEESPPFTSNKFFRFLGSWQAIKTKNKTKPKVLKIGNRYDTDFLEKFTQDEELMKKLYDIGFPFPSSEKVELNVFSKKIPGYVKDYYPSNLEDLLKNVATDNTKGKALGTEIAKKYQKIVDMQSQVKPGVEGILISDIGLFHHGNAMFDKNRNLTFIDMADFISNHLEAAGIKVNKENIPIHTKEFLLDWYRIEAANYIFMATTKETDSRKIIFDGFKQAYPAKGDEVPINNSFKFYKWKMDELNRLLNDGFEISLKNLSENLRKYFIYGAPKNYFKQADQQDIKNWGFDGLID